MNASGTTHINRNSNIHYAVLILIVLSGFLLRFYGIWFGYPLVTHPDEPYIVNRALKILHDGDLNPHFFDYPSLTIYLQAVICAVTEAYQYLIHGVHPNEFPNVFFYISGRGFAAIASSLSIVIVWIIGRKFISPISGIVAAGLVAFSPLHVSNSYLVKPDIWIAIFTTIVLYFSFRIFESGRLRDYLLGGLFVGLATGSKYPAFISFITIFVAHILYSQNQKINVINKKIIFSAITSGLTFFVTTPYSIFDFKTFSSNLHRVGKGYLMGHPGPAAVGNHTYSLYGETIYTADGLGLFAVMLAIIGLFYCFQKKKYEYLLLIAFPLLLYFFVGYFNAFYPRNIVAAIPPLALLSAYGLHALLSKPFTGDKYFYLAGISALSFMFMAGPLLSKSFDETYSTTLPDTRWLSVQWIQNHIPRGSTIARENYTPPIEHFSKNFNVIYLGVSGAYRHASMIDSSVDYIILSSGDYSRFFDGTGRYADQIKYYSDLFNHHQLVFEINPESGISTGPTILIFSNSNQ
jgi:4-amino-4-deoxy-L-arabinose transferase-like glycosyltransferase